MTEETQTSPTEGTSAPEEGTPEQGPSGIESVIKGLNKAGSDMMALGKGIENVPVLKELSGPIQAVSQVVSGIGGRLQAASDEAKQGKEEGGVVGQGLGFLQGFLGGGSPEEGSAEGEEGQEGEDGEKGGMEGFIEKAAEGVGKLREIWGKYYQELFDKEGKLNKEKLAGLAMEVGETILGAKKMAKVKKALAIGNVVRSTAESVMVATKSAPFPANLPAIAQAVAIGATQLATVKGQAHDGLTNVPSTGTYLLEKGERVVGRQLNADLQGFLHGQAQSVAGTSYGAVTNTSNTVNNSPNINMSFSGDVRDDAVRSNRGAIENMIREVFADYAMEPPFG